MADIYLCGHGEWSRSGFTRVPEGTSVLVYTPMGRFLSEGQSHAIMAGAADAMRPYQVFRQYDGVPDMTLLSSPEFADGDARAAMRGGAWLFRFCHRAGRWA